MDKNDRTIVIITPLDILRKHYFFASRLPEPELSSPETMALRDDLDAAMTLLEGAYTTRSTKQSAELLLSYRAAAEESEPDNPRLKEYLDAIDLALKKIGYEVDRPE